MNNLFRTVYGIGIGGALVSFLTNRTVLACIGLVVVIVMMFLQMHLMELERNKK